jgi:hypothetical protein
MFRAVTKSSESCLVWEKQEKESSEPLVKRKEQKKAKTIGIASFACSLNRVKASEISGEDGGRFGPPITRSTEPFTTCDTSLWARQSQQRGTSSLTFKVVYTWTWGRKCSWWVSSEMVALFARRIKTEVGRRYPRPCTVSVTLLWARNLTNNVDSDGDEGSIA